MLGNGTRNQAKSLNAVAVHSLETTHQ